MDRRPTRSAGRGSMRGLTLIEITVVIAVLLLIAGTVTPNVVTTLRTRKLLDTEAAIARLPSEARHESSALGVPVRLRIDGTALVMEQTPADGDPIEVKRVDLGTEITVDSAQEGGNPTDTASWIWTAYPDGSSDAAGLVFAEGKTHRSLSLPANSDARWIKGDLPDTSQDNWPAGELEQRSG